MAGGKAGRPMALAGAAILGVAMFGLASADKKDAAKVIHEDVKSPPFGRAGPGGDASGQSIFGPDPGAGQNPAAFADKGKILPKPDADQKPANGEPVLGRGGIAADRDTESRPDYQTGPDSTLKYVTVFNPSVLPFKRMSGMDAVHDDYTMFSASARTRQDLTVGGNQSSDRDLFWGSLVIDFKTGVDVAIPSVAPDMRILSYEVKPRNLSIAFSKDAADNYYARTDETGVSGTFRLVFLADASADYFSAPVPTGYRASEVARMPGAPDVVALPPRAQAMGERGLAALGVTASMDVRTALDKLVYYFRDFSAKQAPPSTGDIYWDLFTSQAGVCRHRSFAFLITAKALGLPTRYLTNEAHAWVEVWVPESGWIRIDLGGAALRMEVSNAADKTIYRPREKDSFSQPPAYKNNYTQLEGDITGLSQDQIDEARTPVDPDGTGAGDGDGDSDGDGDADPGGTRVGPGRSLPTVPPSALENKTRTSVGVGEVDSVGFRGETIRVSGTLVRADTDTGVGGQRIDIYLAPQGYGGDDAVVVGHTVTGADGSYSAEVDLPRTIDVGEYEVYAATPGDSGFAPAVSQ